MADVELKGSATMTVGRLLEKIGSAPKDLELAIAIGDDPAQLKELSLATGAHIIWSTIGTCPKGTVWGNVKTESVAIGMLVMPPRGRVVQDRGPNIIAP